MYQEIIENLEKQLPSNQLEQLKNKTLYLGVFSEPYLSLMLEGQKKIESRFSKNKTIPYEKITKEDIVIIKRSSGKVEGYFTIKEVLFFNLDNTSIEEIRKKYEKELCVTEEFWNQKKQSHYATLLIIDRLIKLKPFTIHKKGMQSFLKINKEKEELLCNTQNL